MKTIKDYIKEDKRVSLILAPSDLKHLIEKGVVEADGGVKDLYEGFCSKCGVSARAYGTRTSYVTKLREKGITQSSLVKGIMHLDKETRAKVFAELGVKESDITH